MPNNWKTYKLSEVIKIIGGGTPKTSESSYWNGNIPWLSVKDFQGERKYVYETEKTITEEGLKKSSTKLLPKDSIIISARGTVGEMAVLGKEMTFNQSCYGILPNEKIGNDYLYYLLKQKVTELQSLSYGSVFDTITTKTFDGLDVFIPEDLQEQKAIASILSTIDDKIENNLAINKTLEEMAMALYKHWFVDYGPFQDGEFVESELGRIPKGWEVKRLENFVEVLSKGTTPRMKDVEGLERKIPFLKVKDINSDGEININGLELIPEETHLKDLKRSILFENDLLFSIAGTIGRVSIVTEKLNNSNCNQALAFIRLKEREKFKAIIYYWLKSDDVQNKIQNSIVQGVQANVSLTVLKELELIEPSNEILIDFANKVNPILELVLKNQKENQTLTQLRDTLLPKLISGEVRLKEFQES